MKLFSLPALAAIVFWALFLLNGANFVAESVDHHGQSTWSAYGYAALVGLCAVSAAYWTTRTVRDSLKK